MKIQAEKVAVFIEQMPFSDYTQGKPIVGIVERNGVLLVATHGGLFKIDASEIFGKEEIYDWEDVKKDLNPETKRKPGRPRKEVVAASNTDQEK